MAIRVVNALRIAGSRVTFTRHRSTCYARADALYARAIRKSTLDPQNAQWLTTLNESERLP